MFNYAYACEKNMRTGTKRKSKLESFYSNSKVSNNLWMREDEVVSDRLNKI